ncbi:MAG: SDR family oxidoreductase [Hyphomicrobiaceae bacterium]|nr:SDR family oxidoreductase [Hyphomicrobiaceae bacterium]
MTSLFSLEGRVACVTGASSGIGRFLATTLAQSGAAVVGVARRRAELDAWKQEALKEGAHADFIVCDLGDPAGAADVAEQAVKPFGPPDILVNAAGINPRKHADDVDPEIWRHTVDLNLSVPFFLSQKLVPDMAARGWGRIINIASLQSHRAFANGLAYGASKGGVVQLTRAMAEAWSDRGITCNALAPGFFPTELTGPVFSDDDLAGRMAEQTCIGRNGRMEDLIGPAIFLASPASDYVTGQVLHVDGGFTAK